MAWDDNLLQEQKKAASHIGSHSRILAGPGTGKTLCLTRKIVFLIEQKKVEPQNILCLTFTRAASFELRQRVRDEIGNDQKPNISTLHSFALRQLLRNSKKIKTLPQPIRIADNWEERNIILEDIKALLNLREIKDARKLLNDLSSDWQTLIAEKKDWEKKFPNPRFLGAWREHRQIYGYALRSELVYQLKRALEQYEDFDLEGTPQYLLVDEYQDLNRCDLAVIKFIEERGACVIAAGDDDQSIYGFRKAHPEGIRRFTLDYQHAEAFTLEICKRCDKEILELGLFVARQDYNRIDKNLRPEKDCEEGEIAILRFKYQVDEAEGVANICKYLIDKCDIEPHNILILMRSDRYGYFSKPLRNALQLAEVPVGVSTNETNPIDRSDGRKFLSILRLLANYEDHLAWRTILENERGIGPKATDAIYVLAKKRNIGFANALLEIQKDPTLISSPQGKRIQNIANSIQKIIEELRPLEHHPVDDIPEFYEIFDKILSNVQSEDESRQEIIEYLELTIKSSLPTSILELLRAVEVSDENIEQEIEKDKVNILTMHKAKGLTADAVIIIASEDEYLPGRAEGEAIDDERRLLYVSLTRAKHYLFITYSE